MRRALLIGAGLAAAAAVAVLVLLRPAANREIGLANHLPAGASVDSLGRLQAWPSKRKVACPAGDEKTRVLLVLGQSNAGNHAGHRIAARPGTSVVNYYEGKCYVASSPLLGASGQGGEPWTLLGQMMIESGLARTVVLIPFAVAGSSVRRWADGGDLSAALGREIGRWKYRPTHVLWTQGEADFARGMSSDDYRRLLTQVLAMLRAHQIDAPFYVAAATKCAGSPAWRPDNPVAAAQRGMDEPHLGVFAGPDLDRVLGDDDRFDGCHLTASGLAKAAQGWARALGAAAQPAQ